MTAVASALAVSVSVVAASVSVLCDQEDQVVPTHQVDDIDAVSYTHLTLPTIRSV